MKIINNVLHDANEIVFIDFEGTQITQEIIAIGAVKVTLDNKKMIKDTARPFKVYVSSSGVVGPVVTKLTGITDNFLFVNGLSFDDALKKLENYCGSNLNFTSFITYGNYDMRLLHQTALQNNIFNNTFIETVYKKHIDFSSLLARYVKSDRGEMLSLTDALRKFNVTPQGDVHDPESDAVNLSLLYNAFLRNKKILREEYLKVISHSSHMPTPLQKTFKKLINEGSATVEDLTAFIDEELK